MSGHEVSHKAVDRVTGMVTVRIPTTHGEIRLAWVPDTSTVELTLTDRDGSATAEVDARQLDELGVQAVIFRDHTYSG